MRAVDKADQLVTIWAGDLVKWWKQCFGYLIECSLLNAYVLEARFSLNSILKGGIRRGTIFPFV